MQLHRTSSRSMIFQRQECRNLGPGAERITSTYFSPPKSPATATDRTLKSFMLGAGRRLPALILCLGMILAISSICVVDDKEQTPSCSEDTVTASGPYSGESGSTAKTSEAGKARSIKLTWTASVPASSARQDVVQGYNILRHEPGDVCEHNPSTCHKINNKDHLIPGTSCVDYGVRSGHIYIYQAQGISVSGVPSKLSNTAQAKLP